MVVSVTITLLAVSALAMFAMIVPVNDPVNEPVMDTPEAPEVATMLPVPFIALVLRSETLPPPITTDPEVRLSTLRVDSSAELPETTTFFHVGIFLGFYLYKYVLFNLNSRTSQSM